MGEHITKIKIGNDVHCISLDTLVIDTAGLSYDGSDKLGVRLGSSMFADDSGIGVKIHPDTQNCLRPELSGLSLKLDTMANDMANATAGAMRKRLGLVIDAYKNLLKIGTDAEPLKLGTGLIGGDNGRTLCLSLGSGLEFTPRENKIRLKVHDDQFVLSLLPDGELTFNLNRLYDLLESRYNLTKK